jgi:hypothetical protein
MTSKDATIDRRTLMTRILAGGLTAPVMTGSIKAETKGAAHGSELLQNPLLWAVAWSSTAAEFRSGSKTGVGWQVAIERQPREFIHFKEYVKHLIFVCLHIVDTIVLPNVANAGNGASDGSAEASQTV